MEKRQQDLSALKLLTEKLDKDMTMILQCLQWDRKHLLEGPVFSTCKHNSNHRIPPDKIEIHEQQCFLAYHGYDKDDLLLPDPLDPNANTLVRLDNAAITNIIDYSLRLDPLFKKGTGAPGPHLLTLERLRVAYSPDERRAIHDAVVQAVPFCHDLADLALPSDDAQQSNKSKSRLEILAELRDMKRRRTKYRVAAKTRNYSDVLRDVIKTQMELYTDVKLNKSKHYEDDSRSQTGRGDEFPMKMNRNDNGHGNSGNVVSYKLHMDFKIKKEMLREETPLLDEPKLEDKFIEEYRKRESTGSRKDQTKDKYGGGSRKSTDNNSKSRHHFQGDRERGRRYRDDRRDSDYVKGRSDDRFNRYDLPSSSKDREEYRDRSKEKHKYYNSTKEEKYKRYYDPVKEDKGKRKRYS